MNTSVGKHARFLYISHKCEGGRWRAIIATARSLEIWTAGGGGRNIEATEYSDYLTKQLLTNRRAVETQISDGAGGFEAWSLSVRNEEIPVFKAEKAEGDVQVKGRR